MQTDSAPSSSATSSSIPWSFWDAMTALFIGYFAVPHLADNLIELLAPAISPSMRTFWQQCTLIPVWLYIFWLFSRMHPGHFLEDLGLKFPKSLRYYVTSLLLVIISQCLIVLLLAQLRGTAGVDDTDPYQSMPAEKLRMISFFAVISAPFIEEIVYRGFLQGTLNKYMRPWAAVLITALIFTVPHTLYAPLSLAQLHVFFMGLLFGAARQITGSVWPSVMGHLFNNLMTATRYMY